MITEFEALLDNLVSSYEGLSKSANVVGHLSPSTNIYSDDSGAEGPDAKRKPKQGKSPLSSLSGAVSKSIMPNGVGSLEGNGNPITPVSGGFGGMDVTAAFKSVKELVRKESLTKLGLRKESQRFLPFGPSEDINKEKILGFAELALKVKSANHSHDALRKDPTFKKVADLGLSTLSAIADSLSDILFPAAGMSITAGKVLTGNPIGTQKNDLLIHAPMLDQRDGWRKSTDI